MNVIVYKTTNRVNGKVYVGIHETADPSSFDGYLGSGKALKASIRKYGKEAFLRETLCACDTVEEAAELEALIIDEEFVARRDTYNMTVGGKGGFAFLNKRLQEEPELKSKLRKSMSRAARGKKKSEQHKLAISLSQKGRYYHPDKNPMQGKKHSQETKSLISSRRQGKSFCKWVTNGSDNLYILKDSIVPLGYRLGRTMKRDNLGRVA